MNASLEPGEKILTLLSSISAMASKMACFISWSRRGSGDVFGRPRKESQVSYSGKRSGDHLNKPAKLTTLLDIPGAALICK